MIFKIYKILPYFLQHWVVTIKNAFVYYKKYRAIPLFRPLGKVQQKLLSEQSLKYNDDQVCQRINQLTTYARQHTEYYQNLNVEIQSVEEISKIPILKKQALRSNISKFYSSEISQFNATKFKTSGSTGAPMSGFLKISDLQYRYLIILKSMLNFGIDLTRCYGRFPGADLADEGLVYRKDFLNKHFLFSIFQLSEKNIHKYFEAIKNNQIEILEGYPSVLYTLVNLLSKRGHRLSCVKYVITTAEKLHDFQREKISKFFGCEVFDFYGSSEQSSYIYTCPNGRYHNANVISHLEVLDSDWKPVPNGSSGRMVITSFTSHFTPLIRYDIGDMCIVDEDQNCSCGTGGILIKEIIGRDEDVFQTRDGRYFSRFSLVLKYLPDQIIESQLVLSNKNQSATVFYKSLESIELNEFKPFKQKLKKSIGQNYEVNFNKVEKLSRSSRGKVRAVIIDS